MSPAIILQGDTAQSGASDRMCTVKMHKRSVVSSLAAALCVCASVTAGEVREPTLWADVPDVSMCRKGGKYFMVSTTMHFNPGIPVMVSQDLVN